MKASVWVRKVLLVLGAIIVAYSNNVRAAVSVRWVWDQNAAQPVVMADGVTLLPTNSTIQLIWSPDAVAGPINLSDPLTPTGGDVLLDAKGNESEGYWNFGVGNYDAGGSYVGGYVYQRVFSVPLGLIPSPATHFGTGLFMSSALADADGDPPPPADNSFLWSSSGSPFVLMTILPEPGSVILVFLGFFIFLIRRRYTDHK